MNEKLERYLTKAYRAVCGAPLAIRNFVPDNAHPDLSSPYDDFRKIYGDGTITEICKPEYTTIADKLGFEPLTQSPEAACALLKEIQNRANYGRYEQSSLLYELALLDAIKQDGLDDEQMALLRAFHHHYKPNEDFIDWEKERWQQAFTELEGNERLLRLFTGYKAQANYFDVDEARAQYELRHEMFQTISDALHRAFDIEPVSFYLPRMPDDVRLNGFAAMVFNHEDNFIAINYKSTGDCARSLSAALSVLAEEAKHSIDYHIAMQLKNGEISPGDIRANHAAVTLSNVETYIIKNHESYRRQYLERNAKAFRRMVSRDLTNALYKKYEEQRATMRPFRGVAP